MENERPTPDDEYQASEEEHDIYQPEKEPEVSRPSSSSGSKKPIWLLLGLVLLIILLYKLYAYFSSAPKEPVPYVSTATTQGTTMPAANTPAVPATTTVIKPNIPSITPATTVSPAANIPKTQPAAAAIPSINTANSAVQPNMSATTPTQTQTQLNKPSTTLATATPTQLTPSTSQPVSSLQPSVQPATQPQSATTAQQTLQAQKPAQLQPQKTPVSTTSTTQTTLPTVLNPQLQNQTSTLPVGQSQPQKTPSSTVIPTPSVTPNTSALPVTTSNDTASGNSAATDAMQNNRLDALEQGMNQNRIAIQNIQNQINSLASSVTNLQSGINSLNNTLATIKNAQTQVRLVPKIPVKSTIIKHKKTNRLISTEEAAYLTPHTTTIPVASPSPLPPQGSMRPASGGAQYYVKAMIQGRAWLVTGDGTSTVTVSSGDYLPGYGLVEDISPSQGIVTTSSGGIIQFNPADR